MILNPTTYDGTVELAAMQLGYECVGFTSNEAYHKTSKQIVKNHLMQACDGPNCVLHPFASWFFLICIWFHHNHL